jgi:hypothetical protein
LEVPDSKRHSASRATHFRALQRTKPCTG